MGIYADFMDRRCRKHAKDKKAKVNAPDPLGVDKPLVVTLAGRVGENTDLAVSNAIRSQGEEIANAKQGLAETETGVKVTNRLPFEKNELADAILRRKAFKDAIEANRLDDFIAEEIAASEAADAALEAALQAAKNGTVAGSNTVPEPVQPATVQPEPEPKPGSRKPRKQVADALAGANGSTNGSDSNGSN